MRNKNEIIEYIYNNQELIKYCKKVGKRDWQELRSELVGQLYLMDFNKLLIAYYNDFLLYLCFTITSRIEKGRIPDTGFFYKHSSVNDEAKPEDIIEPEYIEIDIEKVYDRILELVDEQHWYNKTLFRNYYVDGMKLREISALYGINEKSIHYAITKVKNELKKKMKDDDANPYN